MMDLTAVCHHNRVESVLSHLLQQLALWINVPFMDKPAVYGQLFVHCSCEI